MMSPTCSCRTYCAGLGWNESLDLFARLFVDVMMRAPVSATRLQLTMDRQDGGVEFRVAAVQGGEVDSIEKWMVTMDRQGGAWDGRWGLEE